jgi:hypothetical protein
MALGNLAAEDGGQLGRLANGAVGVEEALGRGEEGREGP